MTGQQLQSSRSAELLIRLYDLCEQQGRDYVGMKALVEHLVDADTVDQVVSLLVSLLEENTTARRIASAAALKDGRRAIKVAQRILARIDDQLEGSVVTTVRRHRANHSVKRKCPACDEEKGAQGLPNHLRHVHGWSDEAIESWRDHARA